MGCNQSSENQWAYSSENAPLQKVCKSFEIVFRKKKCVPSEKTYIFKIILIFKASKPVAIVAPSVPVPHTDTTVRECFLPAFVTFYDPMC